MLRPTADLSASSGRRGPDPEPKQTCAPPLNDPAYIRPLSQPGRCGPRSGAKTNLRAPSKSSGLQQTFQPALAGAAQIRSQNNPARPL